VIRDHDLQVNLWLGDRRPVATLTYWRDGAWHDLSDRLLVTPDFPLAVVRRVQGVATASFALDNGDGLLARDNEASALNRNAADAFDPLLDATRRVRIEQGALCRANAAEGKSYTVSPAPHATYPDTSPTATKLTNGTALSTTAGDFVGWQADPVITLDLGSVQELAAVALVCLSRTKDGIRLPLSVAAEVSTDGADYTTIAMFDCSYLMDDPGGRAVLLPVALDLGGREARYVRLTLTRGQAGDFVLVSEVMAYAAPASEEARRVTFTGMLGDDITQGAEWGSVIQCAQVRDVSKRLDDRFIEVYATYEQQTIEGIIADLLTAARYGLQLGASEYALDATGFVMPTWTTQNRSVFRACQDLARIVGWEFVADEQGVYRLRDLPREDATGEQVLRAGLELIDWVKGHSDLDLRNKVIVRNRSGTDSGVSASAADEVSIARYGERLFVIAEPSIRTATMARALARAVLHDYSQVQRTGAGEAPGTPLLSAGHILAVHEPLATAATSAQLYRVDRIESAQTGAGHGDYRATLRLRGFRPRLPEAPTGFSATEGDNLVALSWAARPEAYVVRYRVTRALTATGAETVLNEPAGTSYTDTTAVNGTTYWYRVAAVVLDGGIGDAAGPLRARPQAAGGGTNDEGTVETPTGLTVALVNWFGIQVPKLAWQHPANSGRQVMTYVVERGGAAGGPFAEVGAVTFPPSRALFYVDRRVPVRTPGTSYYYRVLLFDARSGFRSAVAGPTGVTY